jgi:sortase A
MFKVLITIVVVIVAGIVIGTSASGFVNRDNDKQVLSTQTQNQQTEDEVSLPGIPVRVSIPSINVDAEIESVGNDEKGRMDVPEKDENTAWYNPGFRPGMNGNAVLAGHFDKKDGSPAVFWDLEKLGEGDEIIVTDDKGKEWKFAVTKSQKHANKDFPLATVFGNADAPMLNLITCDGEWSAENGYADRYVVYSKLVTE